VAVYFWIWIWIVSRQGPRTEASHRWSKVSVESNGTIHCDFNI